MVKALEIDSEKNCRFHSKRDWRSNEDWRFNSEETGDLVI